MRKLWHKKTIVIVLMAFAISFLITNSKGDVWEESVRQLLYQIKNDSVPDYAVEHMDDKGIPWVYYPEQNGITAGKQYNATIVCNYAIDYYHQYLTTKDSATQRKFLHCINWLADAMTVKDNYAIYYFQWQQPWYPAIKVPWTCGMTSGRAIEAFTYAFRLYQDSTYLYKAKQLVNGYFLPIQDGGFTYKEANGWWYEENADTGMVTPRILDGHIYAISGLQVYNKQVKDDSVQLLIQKGLQALKYQLPNYDAGGGKIWYNADNKVADKKYHRILTAQMKLLWEYTGDEMYLKYFNQWNAPLQQFYLQRMIVQGNISGLLLFASVFLVSAIGLYLIALLLPQKFK
jgi:hypothetical protein